MISCIDSTTGRYCILSLAWLSWLWIGASFFSVRADYQPARSQPSLSPTSPNITQNIPLSSPSTQLVWYTYEGKVSFVRVDSSFLVGDARDKACFHFGVASAGNYYFINSGGEIIELDVVILWTPPKTALSL